MRYLIIFLCSTVFAGDFYCGGVHNLDQVGSRWATWGIKWNLDSVINGVVENGEIILYFGQDSKRFNGPDIINYAVQALSSIPGSRLKIKLAGQTAETYDNFTHNLIMFSSSYKFDNNALGTTLIKNGRVCVILNENMLWGDKISKCVAMHELGHMVGLGHSAVEAAIMYYAQGIGSRPTWDVDDANGIVSLYPDKSYVGPHPGDIDYPIGQVISISLNVSSGDYAPSLASFGISGVDYWASGAVFHWDFGDGTTSAERFPRHTYNQGGTYVATLDLSDYKNKWHGTATIIVSDCRPLNISIIGTLKRYALNDKLSLKIKSSYIGSYVFGDTSFYLKKNSSIINLTVQKLDINNDIIIETSNNGYKYKTVIPSSAFTVKKKTKNYDLYDVRF